MRGKSAILFTFLLCRLATSSPNPEAEQAVFNNTPYTTSTEQVDIGELNTTISKLEGWHARALESPYPTPDTFNWTSISKDQFDIFAHSSSMMDPNRLTVAFLRDNDNRRVVVDSMGRVLVPLEEDYLGMVRLARHVVREEFYDGEYEDEEEDDNDEDEEDEEVSKIPVIPPKPKVLVKKTHQYWTIDWGGATCQPGDYWHVRVLGGEWKGHSVSGFAPKENRKLKKSVNGVKEMPAVLHAFMSLTYEAETWGIPNVDVDSWQHENIRRAMKTFKGYYY
ncbi:hypothetical protein V5O48_005352 [Marasmius crinis-equi]|uniref:Uncharacterized protein n=1 Tax=Marasmius crinis-equi TaxID=585013 RepID=A0ABR3FMX0_9AGAR